jgi:hypothetical protein
MDENDVTLDGDAAVSHEGTLMATVRAMLDGYEYRYHLMDPSTLWLYIRNEAGLYALCFLTNEDARFMRIVGSYGSGVPDDRRVAVAELLSRINVRLGFGNFELDFDDGEVRFRVGEDVQGTQLTEAVVDRMLGYTLVTLDRYHQAVMTVAFGTVEPVVAMAAVA